MRKTLGLIVAVAMTTSLIGVAWASNDVESQTEIANQTDSVVGPSIVAEDDSTSTSLDEGARSAGLELDDTTPTTIDDEQEETDTTPTTIDDREDEDDDATPTTIDDREDDDDDGDLDDDDEAEEETGPVFVGTRAYTIPEVGAVTVELTSNALVLVGVEAPGWDVTVEKAEYDRIEIEFHRDGAEAGFEAELESNGTVSIEIESD